MDIQQIKYFLILAEELHFWNTSEKVGITQSALSRQIMSLESELNLKLFDRDKRNVSLTSAGQYLKEKWQFELSTLEIVHQQALQIHLGKLGTIKIAHPDSISSTIIPEIISKISYAFPQLNMELLQLPYSQEEEALKNYKIDILLSRDMNQSVFLHSKKLSSDNLCLVVPTDHDFKTPEDITSVNLANQKFILTYGGSDSRYDSLLQDIFKHYNIHPSSFISSQFGSTIISLIKKGLGIAILPQSYSHYDPIGLRFIPLPFFSDLYINWRKDDPNIIIKNIMDLI
ncbi:Transcriptional regulator, LysR family [Sphingobacterium sp. PM2-P1-29]|jgi:LysR family transcriptional activator of glutamate synthase operon|nr:Transcriptional regulator, LysR family [Sphingobacterium sp. PM2-P1-29]